MSLLLALLLSAPLGLVATTSAFADREPVDRIVLRVNNEIVTLLDFERRKQGEVSAILADPRIDATTRQERLGRAGQEVMQSLYRETLLTSQAKRKGLTVDEREVDEAVQNVMRAQGLETREQLDAALAQSDMVMDDLRENLRQELLLSQVVRREVTSQIEVTVDEARAVYRNNPHLFEIPERRNLREVLVLDSTGEDDEVLRARALEVRAALANAGGELLPVLQPWTDAEQTTGVVELGWLRSDELADSLSDAAFALEPGTWSEPVRARGGFHLLLVDEVEGGGLREYDEVEEAIRAREQQKRFGDELQNYLAKLETTSYIVEDLPPDAVGFRDLGDAVVLEDELESFRQPLPDGSLDVDTDAPASSLDEAMRPDDLSDG